MAKLSITDLKDIRGKTVLVRVDYNVPLDEMEQIMENAIANNYSIAWASDVSEPYFSHKNGLAIVPEKEMEAMTKEEKEILFTQSQKPSSPRKT